MNRSALFAAATAVATTTALGLTGTTSAIGAPRADPGTSPAAAVSRAKAAAGENLGALRATSADAFVVRDVIVDPDGSSHVRMDRTVGGLRVLGGDVVVHQNRDGGWKGASLTPHPVRERRPDPESRGHRRHRQGPGQGPQGGGQAGPGH